MKYMLSIILCLTAVNAGAEEIFPAGCKPIMVKDELITLVADQPPSLVMIHNLSTMDLWMTHPVSESNASAGWSSHLQAGNWSALALTSKTFELSCIESRPGHEQQVPCAGLLALCQWMPVTLPKTDAETFWAGENMTLSALTAHVGSRGVVIPTTPAS